MNNTNNYISPLEINHAMRSIFVVDMGLANEQLSKKVRMATVKEIVLRDIYNDSENGKIILNRNMKDETPFPYAYTGIYRTENDAKLGASAINREQSNTLQSEIDTLYKAIQDLEKVQLLFTGPDGLKKVGLI